MARPREHRDDCTATESLPARPRNVNPESTPDTKRDEFAAREDALRVRTRVLVELSRSHAQRAGDFEGAMAEITEAAANALKVERVGIWLFDEQCTCIRCTDLYERSRCAHSSGFELAAADHPHYFRSLDADRTLATTNAQTDPRTHELNERYLKPAGITSMMDAPVRLRARLIGVICHEHVGPPREWTVDDQMFAGSLADFVAMIVQSRERDEAEHALRAQRAFLRQVLDINPNLIFVKDRRGRFTLVNKSLADAYGTTAEALIGRSDSDFNDNAEEVANFLRDDLEVMNSCRRMDIPEETVTDASGRVRWLQTVKLPVLDETGEANQVLGVATDITDRKRAEEALRASEARFRAFMENSPAVAWIKDAEGRYVYCNEFHARIFQPEGRTFLGATDFELWPEPIARMLRENDQRVLDTNQPIETTEDVPLPTGKMRHWMVFKFPIEGEQEAKVKKSKSRKVKSSDLDVSTFGPVDLSSPLIGGMAIDITDRTRTEQRQALLIRELDHRVKNNLAAVLSIAEQSISTTQSLDEFHAAFTGRIRAMAVVHESLARTQWDGAELGELVRSLFEPYRHDRPTPWTIDGPEIILPAEVAPPLGMALHELIVNAAKYGALSTPDGRVDLRWKVQSDPQTGRILELKWREKDGPAVQTSPRRGLGSDLIERLIQYQLRGESRIAFEKTGVQCTMRVPLNPARNGFE